MSEPTERAASSSSRVPDAWLAAMPVAFVLLWSTGFLGAKLGLPYAEPFTFLFLRFAILSVVLTAAALALRAPWPKGPGELARAAVVGMLVHGVYLSGVFSAIHAGVPAGVAALIVGLQPVLTGIAAGPLLGERVRAIQWLGLTLGFVGVALVVSDKLAFDEAHLHGVVYALVALMGITAGTLYQKKHGTHHDLRTINAVHYIAAAVPVGLLALTFDTEPVQWTGEFVFALGWLVVVLSVGAISLLWALVRRGQAAKVASLFYLTPPVTAVLAWVLFGETLGPLAIAGMAVAVVGVALVVRK